MNISKIIVFLLVFGAAGSTARGQTEATLTNEEKLFGLAKLWSEAKYNFANFDLTKDRKSTRLNSSHVD